MSTSIGDVRANIERANQNGSNALHATSAAIAELKAQKAALQRVTAGSPHTDVSAMIAAIDRAIEHLEQGLRLIVGAMSAARDVQARL